MDLVPEPWAVVRPRARRRQRQRLVALQVLLQQPLLPVVPDDDLVVQVVLVLGAQRLVVMAVLGHEDGAERLGLGAEVEIFLFLLLLLLFLLDSLLLLLLFLLVDAVALGYVLLAHARGDVVRTGPLAVHPGPLVVVFLVLPVGSKDAANAVVVVLVISL
ncbi:MYND finger [Apiospora arundinis]